jgi:hypothetical protein
MTIDPDGDSEMLSSPESGKFAPGPNDPRTPRAPPGLTEQFPASELSPPGSQGVANTKQPITRNEAIGSVSAVFANSRKAIEQKSTEATEAKNAPGSSWMNKRAEEEYQRAMEYVVDLDFSLRKILPRFINRFPFGREVTWTNAISGEFGDPFDDRQISQRGP